MNINRLMVLACPISFVFLLSACGVDSEISELIEEGSAGEYKVLSIDTRSQGSHYQFEAEAELTDTSCTVVDGYKKHIAQVQVNEGIPLTVKGDFIEDGSGKGALFNVSTSISVELPGADLIWRNGSAPCGKIWGDYRKVFFLSSTKDKWEEYQRGVVRQVERAEEQKRDAQKIALPKKPEPPEHLATQLATAKQRLRTLSAELESVYPNWESASKLLKENHRARIKEIDERVRVEKKRAANSRDRAEIFNAASRKKRAMSDQNRADRKALRRERDRKANELNDEIPALKREVSNMEAEIEKAIRPQMLSYQIAMKNAREQVTSLEAKVRELRELRDWTENRLRELD